MTVGRRWSLSRRVALVAVIVLAGWVVVLTVGVNLVVTARLAQEADDLLRTEAQLTADTIEIGPDSQLILPTSTNDAALDVGTWILHGTNIVQGPSDSQSLNAEAMRLADRGQAFDQTGGPNGVRWYSEPIFDGDRQVGTVVTALSLAPYQSTGQYTLAGTAVLALLLLTGAYLVLHAGVARALRPVEEMTNQAARWSTDDVDRRFGDAPRPAELDELARTLDGVLDRLGAVLRHERQLSDELSHELRTPLARIQAEVDLLRGTARDRQEQERALTVIDAAAGAMGGILETLMAAARSSNGHAPGRSTAAEVLAPLLRRAVAGRPGLTARCTVPDCLVVGLDAAVLERIAAPVVDNAARHAVREVRIEGVRRAGSVSLGVVDDGPGIPEEHAERVFEPGWRGDPSDGHDGAGLGLALSRRLAVAAGGRIAVAPAETGARFVIDLPGG